MTQMGRNAAAGRPISWHQWTEAAVDWCLAWFWAKCYHLCQSMKFWAFTLIPYNAYLFLSIIFVNSLNSYCVTCSILPLSVFCVLRGSGSVARYTIWILLQISWQIRQWENFENWSTFVKLMNECIVAQFLLRHGVLTHLAATSLVFLSVLVVENNIVTYFCSASSA